VLHGKAEKIPFQVFTDSVKSQKEVRQSLFSSLILDHAQVSIAFGDIIIADRVAIAANAAVSKSCLESDVILGGVPAKIIGKVDIFSIIKN
jgi:hypothetical protein